MKKFLDENFLLQTETAKFLYHQHAHALPIIDYHNHLNAQEIVDNIKFDNLTQVWLNGDHYKWRAMRANGIDEQFITGSTSSDWQKFEKWAHTVPYTMRNPLFHWTHLELQRYFGVHQLLNPENARQIYEQTALSLQNPNYSAVGLLNKMKVEVICTTDDPLDSLNAHRMFADRQAESMGIKKLLPTFRPDQAMDADNSVNLCAYVDKMEKVMNKNIHNLDDYLEGLKSRHQYFHDLGCRISDHGLETFYASEWENGNPETIFLKLRAGKNVSAQESQIFKSYLLYHFAIMDAEKGWTQQFHIGAIRNNSARLRNKLGADCGADSIGDFQTAKYMSDFFKKLDNEGKLAKTIVYNLNPAYNDVFATMIGNFQDGSIAGKMQMGAAWWFLDQKDGIEKQINAISQMGLLSRFVGMLTDSRSLLSFPRHEYFRRIVCNIIGNDVENGELPNDMSYLGGLVENISYHNAKNYFNF